MTQPTKEIKERVKELDRKTCKKYIQEAVRKEREEILKMIDELQQKAFEGKLFIEGYGYNNGSYGALELIKKQIKEKK